VERIVEMIKENVFTGNKFSLKIYEREAVLLNKLNEIMFTIHYESGQVNWEAINEAKCQLIDDILFGFDLSDYFGGGYNVVARFN
jgi:hypothetical protein